MSEAGSWRAVGVSLRGSSHVKTDQPCQDVHAFALLPRETLVAAVADGAGTAALAEVGAELAVKAAVETLRERLEKDPLTDAPEEAWRTLLHEAMRAALEAVEREAATRGTPGRDFACTLGVAVARPDMVAAVQVGDGSVVGADGDGAVFSILRPVSGEYLNETTFLISPGALEQIQFARHTGKISRLAMLTDGLQMLALKVADGTPHAPFFEPLFRFIAAAEDEEKGRASLAAFLASDRVQAKADDDSGAAVSRLTFPARKSSGRAARRRSLPSPRWAWRQKSTTPPSRSTSTSSSSW